MIQCLSQIHLFFPVHACTKSLQLSLTLCDPMDHSPPGSSTRGIFQARKLAWIAMSSCRVPSWPRDWAQLSRSPAMVGGFCAAGLSQETQGVWVTQACPTLCDPVDCSLPGSSVHGIVQAGILEWVAISFSRASAWLRNWTLVSRFAGRLFTNWAIRGSPGKPNCLSNVHKRLIRCISVKNVF